MKRPVWGLEGAALNYAVALAEGHTFGTPHIVGSDAYKTWEFPYQTPNGVGTFTECWLNQALDGSQSWERIDDYAESVAGDDLIDKHRISTETTTDEWQASFYNLSTQSMEGTTLGPTRRIAAMRAYVYSKLGDVIEIPEEIIV